MQQFVAWKQVKRKAQVLQNNNEVQKQIYPQFLNSIIRLKKNSGFKALIEIKGRK